MVRKVFSEQVTANGDLSAKSQLGKIKEENKCEVPDIGTIGVCSTDIKNVVWLKKSEERQSRKTLGQRGKQKSDHTGPYRPR